MEFPLWKALQKQKSNPEQEILDFLKETALFGNLKKRTLREITAMVHKREYSATETIFEQGQAGAGLYFIMDGKVKIVSSAEGTDLKLAVLDKYAFFGELSLFDVQPRGASAIAVEDSILLGFFQPELKTIIEKKPKIGTEIIMAITRVIAQRLNSTNMVLEKAYLKAKKGKEDGAKEPEQG